MKKLIRTTLIILILTLTTSVFSQDPPSPNNGNNPDGGNMPVGGRARISGGIAFLLLLGGAYGSKKLFDTFYMESKH